MQNEELSYPEMSYDFEFFNDSYVFETSEKIKYRIRFKPSPYVFGEDVIFAPYLYELIIELAGNELPSKGTDKLMPYTIYNIFLDFYNRKGDINICLYICDSSDGKQQARARKFVHWFRLLNDTGIIYVGDQIKDLNGIIYPVAVLFRTTNPYYSQIIEAFNNLISTYSK